MSDSEYREGLQRGLDNKSSSESFLDPLTPFRTDDDERARKAGYRDGLQTRAIADQILAQKNRAQESTSGSSGRRSDDVEWAGQIFLFCLHVGFIALVITALGWDPANFQFWGMRFTDAVASFAIGIGSVWAFLLVGGDWFSSEPKAVLGCQNLWKAIGLSVLVGGAGAVVMYGSGIAIAASLRAGGAPDSIRNGFLGGMCFGQPILTLSFLLVRAALPICWIWLTWRWMAKRENRRLLVEHCWNWCVWIFWVGVVAAVVWGVVVIAQYAGGGREVDARGTTPNGSHVTGAVAEKPSGEALMTLSRARTHLEGGNWSEAMKGAEAALRTDANSEEAMGLRVEAGLLGALERATDAMSRGNPEAALDCVLDSRSLISGTSESRKLASDKINTALVDLGRIHAQAAQSMRENPRYFGKYFQIVLRERGSSTRAVIGLRLNRGTDTVTSITQDGGVTMWVLGKTETRLLTALRRFSLPCEEGRILDRAGFSNDGSLLFTDGGRKDNWWVLAEGRCWEARIPGLDSARSRWYRPTSERQQVSCVNSAEDAPLWVIGYQWEVACARVYDWRTGKFVVEVFGPAERPGEFPVVTCVGYSQSAHRLVLGTRDGYAITFDAISGQALQREHVGSFSHTLDNVRMSPDGRRIIFASESVQPSVRCLAFESLLPVWKANGTLCDMSEDGALVLIENGGEIRVLDAITGDVLMERQIERAPRSLCFGKGGHEIFVGSSEGEVAVFGVAVPKFNDASGGVAFDHLTAAGGAIPQGARSQTNESRWYYFSRSGPHGEQWRRVHPTRIASVKNANREAVVFAFPFKSANGEECLVQCSWLARQPGMASYRSTDGSRWGQMTVTEVGDGTVRGTWTAENLPEGNIDKRGEWCLVREDEIRKLGDPF